MFMANFSFQIHEGVSVIPQCGRRGASIVHLPNYLHVKSNARSGEKAISLPMVIKTDKSRNHNVRGF